MSSNVNLSANMNLPVPVVGVDTGPDWATQLNNCLGLIDTHTHAPGYGVAISPAGMNINADLNFNTNTVLNLLSATFSNNGSILSSLNSVYVSGNNLYYNNGSAVPVQLTNGNSIVGASGSISGLVSPASATYTPATQTFTWRSNVNVPANMDAANFILRNYLVNSNKLTLSPPSPIAADYQIILPNLPTGGTKFLTIDTSGSMYAITSIDNSTIISTSNVLSVNGANIVNGDREHSWELNGNYPALTYPLTLIDSVFFAPYNLTITSVWIYNSIVGTGSITEFDLKVASPGAGWSSILSLTGKIDSTAANNVWTDSGSIVGAQTGVTKPVIGTASILAGQAVRWDLLQSMTGPATDARIRIFYKQS